VEFEANGYKHTMGHYLADGIYPAWATFVKTISNPEGNKIIHFARQQMAVRKDVERAFGVLQARFAIVRGPARFWDEKTLWKIMRSCVKDHEIKMLLMVDYRIKVHMDLQADKSTVVVKDPSSLEW
jgi:hypothetical protein